MRDVPYALTRSDNRGLDPKAVAPERIPNLDMVFELALWMSWLAWPHRPGRGGNRRGDVVGSVGRGIQPVLVATTGLRNGELFALRAGRVDVDRLEVEVVEQLLQEDSGRRYLDRPKHGSARMVTFAGFLAEDLRNLVDHRRTVSGEDDPLLFCAPQGGWEWRSNHTRRFRAAARPAGWPVHLDLVRAGHLYAVTMLERLPLEVVSRLWATTRRTSRRSATCRCGPAGSTRSRAVSREWTPT